MFKDNLKNEKEKFETAPLEIRPKSAMGTLGFYNFYMISRKKSIKLYIKYYNKNVYIYNIHK